MAIDYRYLSTINNPTTRNEVVGTMFRAESYVSLSDAIMATQTGNYAGQLVLVLMDQEMRDGMFNPTTQRFDPMMRRRFRLRVLCDEWGQPVKEGQIIEWKFNIRNRDPVGRKYTSRRKAELRRQGLENEFLEIHAAVVDADSCISLEFQDASKLLTQFGIHYGTGLPISKKRELSGTVQPLPGGGMRHQHNWRYVEVPPDMTPGSVAVSRGRARATIVSTPSAVEPAGAGAPPAGVAPSVETPPVVKQKRKYVRKAKPAPTVETETPPAE